MNLIRSILLLFCISLLFFTSCQKEITNTIEPVTQTIDSCKIIKAYYYGGSGGINDSADFIYSADKLMHVNSSNADVFYYYTGNTLTSMQYFEKPGNLLYLTDTFQYQNGLLTKIIAHDYDMYNHYDTIHSVFNFIYSVNQLQQVFRTDYKEGFPNSIDSTWSTFNYTGGNITSLYTTSNYGVRDTVVYTYDINPNYFSAINKYFFQADPFFQIHVGFEPHLPYFISKNNVIKWTYYTNVDYPIEYQLDSLKHPLLVRSGGFNYMGYKYQCP